MKIKIETHRLTATRKSAAQFNAIMQEMQQSIDALITASTDFEFTDDQDYILSFNASDPEFDAAYEQVERTAEKMRDALRDFRWQVPEASLISVLSEKNAVSGN